MTKGSAVPAALRDALSNYEFIDEIRADDSQAKSYILLVPTSRVGSRSDKYQTSRHQLDMLCKQVGEELSVSLTWVLMQDGGAAAAEETLLAAMRQHFGASVKSLTMSSPSLQPVWVWLEVESGKLDLPPQEDFEDFARKFLAFLGKEKVHLSLVQASRRPAELRTLRALKRLAPASVSELRSALVDSGAFVPSDEWLRKELDRLRKSGLLVSSTSGEYSLTEKALLLVPHGKSSYSSDVERALAFRDKRW